MSPRKELYSSFIYFYNQIYLFIGNNFSYLKMFTIDLKHGGKDQTKTNQQ